MTAQEWLVRLVFRVGRNSFKDAELIIRPLNETPGLEVYGNDQRVWVTNHKGPWQSVTVQVHRLAEIDTPAFRAFLADAVRSFWANVERLQKKPEDLMPWKFLTDLTAGQAAKLKDVLAEQVEGFRAVFAA